MRELYKPLKTENFTNQTLAQQLNQTLLIYKQDEYNNFLLNYNQYHFQKNPLLDKS
jgi:hypothetical protein